jgi:hypothetical protein
VLGQIHRLAPLQRRLRHPRPESPTPPDEIPNPPTTAGTKRLNPRPIRAGKARPLEIPRKEFRNPRSFIEIGERRRRRGEGSGRLAGCVGVRVCVSVEEAAGGQWRRGVGGRGRGRAYMWTGSWRWGRGPDIYRRRGVTCCRRSRARVVGCWRGVWSRGLRCGFSH